MVENVLRRVGFWIKWLFVRFAIVAIGLFIFQWHLVWEATKEFEKALWPAIGRQAAQDSEN